MVTPSERTKLRAGTDSLDVDAADRLPDTLRDEPNGLAGGGSGRRICGDDVRTHTDSGIRTEASQEGGASRCGGIGGSWDSNIGCLHHEEGFC